MRFLLGDVFNDTNRKNPYHRRDCIQKKDRTLVRLPASSSTFAVKIWILCSCVRYGSISVSVIEKVIFFFYEDGEEEVFISPFYKNLFVVIESIFSWNICA